MAAQFQERARQHPVAVARADDVVLVLDLVCPHWSGRHGLAVGRQATRRDEAGRVWVEQWLAEEACDGFNIMPPLFPASLRDFVDLVIPELQRRGLCRNGYQATTLRGNLEVTRPPWPSRAGTGFQPKRLNPQPTPTHPHSDFGNGATIS